MAKPAPKPSPLCRRHEHESCPHKFGGGVERRNRQPVKVAVLCNCDCHAGCPVAGEWSTPAELWWNECTCPGSFAQREREPIIAARAEERKRQINAAIVEADLRRGDSAEVVAGKLRAAAAAHDLSYGSDFSRISRFVAAGAGRRGTRTMRLAIESARGLRAARRRPLPAPDSKNGREIRRLQGTAIKAWAIAGAATIAARVARGRWRHAFTAIAAVVMPLAVIVALIAYIINTLLRAANAPSPTIPVEHRSLR